MKEIEFFTLDDKVYATTETNEVVEINEQSKDLITDILGRVEDYYPQAYEGLKEWYKKSMLNVPYARFQMAQRFIKCNFGELDKTQDDIDSNGGFHFEKINCPMRGECKFEGIVCMPKFDSRLSNAELRVMELYYRNEKIDAIADKLYLSGHTVKNHIRSAFAKLDIHSHAEFISYANRNHLFD